MTGIKIKKSGLYWIAAANSGHIVAAHTAHGVVEMLKTISQTEELEFSNV